MHCDIMSGTRNDADYLDIMADTAKAYDLKLADLGYYKTDYPKQIEDSGASFISKLKSNIAVYIKNLQNKKNRYYGTGKAFVRRRNSTIR